MKKINYFLAITLILFACRQNQSDDVNKALLEAVTSEQETKEGIIQPQAKASFGNDQMEFTGKITEMSDFSYINLNARDGNNNMTYEVVLSFEGKIAIGKYDSKENFTYGITDAVHKTKLSAGGIVPTIYKQKSGKFEITKIENKQVYGTFTVDVYDMNKPEITQNITGSFEKLPIKNLGEN